jgi:hypothetical protein
VIKSGWSQSLLLLVISIACVWFLGSHAAAGPLKKTWFEWFFVAFFGLGLILAPLQLIRPETLTVSPEGVRYAATLKTIELRWADVAGFHPWSPARFVTMVGVEFTSSYEGHPGLRRFNSDAFGVGGALGSGWELDPEPLCDLLNRARERWASKATR